MSLPPPGTNWPEAAHTEPGVGADGVVLTHLTHQEYNSAERSALSLEVRTRLERAPEVTLENVIEGLPDARPAFVAFGGRVVNTAVRSVLPPVLGYWQEGHNELSGAMRGLSATTSDALDEMLRRAKLGGLARLREPLNTPLAYAHLIALKERVADGDAVAVVHVDPAPSAEHRRRFANETMMLASLAYAGVAQPVLWAGLGEGDDAWVQVREERGPKLVLRTVTSTFVNQMADACCRAVEILVALEVVHVGLAGDLALGNGEGTSVFVDRCPPGLVFASACEPDVAQFLMLYLLASDLRDAHRTRHTDLSAALLQRAVSVLGGWAPTQLPLPAPAQLPPPAGGGDVALLQQLEQLRVENERLRRDVAAAGAGDVDEDEAEAEAEASRVRWRDGFTRLLRMFANNEEARRDALEREVEAEWFSMGKEDFDLIGLTIKELYSPTDWPTEEAFWVAQGYTPDEIDRYEVQDGFYFDKVTPKMKPVAVPKTFARRRIALLSPQQWKMLGIGRDDLDDLGAATPTPETLSIYWPMDGIAQALMDVLRNPPKLVVGFLENQAQSYEPWEGKDDVRKRKKALADKEAKRVKGIEDAAKAKAAEEAKKAEDARMATGLRANYDKWLLAWRAMASGDPVMPAGADRTNWTKSANNLLLLMTLLTDKKIGDALNETTLANYTSLSPYLKANGQIVDGILYRLVTHSKPTTYTGKLKEFLTRERPKLQSVVTFPTWWRDSPELAAKYADETPFEIDVVVRRVDGPVLNEAEALVAVEEARAVQQRAVVALAEAETENLRKDEATKLQRRQAVQRAKEAKNDADEALVKAEEALNYAQTVGLTPAQLAHRERLKAEAEAAAEAARVAAARRAAEEAEAARLAAEAAAAAEAAGLLSPENQKVLDAQEALVAALEGLEAYEKAGGAPGIPGLKFVLPVNNSTTALTKLKDKAYANEFVAKWKAEAKAGAVDAAEFVARWREDKGEPPKPGAQAPELTPEEQAAEEEERKKKAKVEGLEALLVDALEGELEVQRGERKDPLGLTDRVLKKAKKALDKEAGKEYADKFVADWKAANAPPPPIAGPVGGHWAEQLLGLQPMQAATTAWLAALLDHHRCASDDESAAATGALAGIGGVVAGNEGQEGKRLEDVLLFRYYERAKEVIRVAKVAIAPPSAGRSMVLALAEMARAGLFV
jgi:hypothetical protein